MFSETAAGFRSITWGTWTCLWWLGHDLSNHPGFSSETFDLTRTWPGWVGATLFWPFVTWIRTVKLKDDFSDLGMIMTFSWPWQALGWLRHDLSTHLTLHEDMISGIQNSTSSCCHRRALVKLEMILATWTWPCWLKHNLKVSNRTTVTWRWLWWLERSLGDSNLTSASTCDSPRMWSQGIDGRLHFCVLDKTLLTLKRF